MPDLPKFQTGFWHYRKYMKILNKKTIINSRKGTGGGVCVWGGVEGKANGNIKLYVNSGRVEDIWYSKW